MGAVRLEEETVFLRAFAQTYTSETSFSPGAEEHMRQQGITLIDVYRALRSGIVVSGEKEDSDGAVWIVEGETPDDVLLRLTLDVWCDSYRVCVVSVARIGV